MTLREKQSLFTVLVSQLILHARDIGYQVTFGEAWRSQEEAARLAAARKGIKTSLHCQRLAIDLNLFIDGVYKSKTSDHRLLGEWWEAQHSLCRWGGRFHDGNHYSMTHNGRS